MNCLFKIEIHNKLDNFLLNFVHNFVGYGERNFNDTLFKWEKGGKTGKLISRTRLAHNTSDGTGT